MKRPTTHAQTCDIMDGMWMERMRTRDTLSHDVSASTCAKCMRKITCEVHPVYTSCRLQWIAIDCKRNQLQQEEVMIH